jgi:DNA-directed RNA polymerase subunit RPC12/RpoP
MPKAILELEMPESCWQCELYSAAQNCCNVIVIVGHYAICPSKGRRSDCPLKLVERCEWILIDDDKGLWQCSKCGAEWVLESGTPADNEMNYCPACGRRLEVEP